jgi:hypothetical protein
MGLDPENSEGDQDTENQIRPVSSGLQVHSEAFFPGWAKVYQHPGIYLGSFNLDPEFLTNLSVGSMWNIRKQIRLLQFSTEHGAKRTCFKA